MWIVFTIMALFLLVISLPPHYRDSMTICDGDDCALLNVTTQGVQIYEQLGVNLERAALYTTIAGAFSAIIFTMVGAIIFFSRLDEVIALMTAFTLVAMGISAPIDYLQPDNIFWEIGLRIICVRSHLVYYSFQPDTFCGDDAYTKARRIRRWAKHGVILITHAHRMLRLGLSSFYQT